MSNEHIQPMFLGDPLSPEAPKLKAVCINGRWDVTNEAGDEREEYSVLEVLPKAYAKLFAAAPEILKKALKALEYQQVAALVCQDLDILEEVLARDPNMTADAIRKQVALVVSAKNEAVADKVKRERRYNAMVRLLDMTGAYDKDKAALTTRTMRNEQRSTTTPQANGENMSNLDQEMARNRMLQVIHFLRSSMAEAKKNGAPKIGILSVKEDGSGKVIAQLDAPEFVVDLCRILGVPVSNTQKEDADAAAMRILGMLGGGSVRL